MKIRLLINEDEAEYLKKKLEESGFEISDDGEYILTKANCFSGFLSVRNKDGQKVIISEDSIIFVESFGHDVEVHTEKDLYYSQERLYRLSELLNGHKFLRVSNSAIIAKSHVMKIKPTFSMKFVLTMSDGTQIDVTRSYYYSFKESFRI